jgi:hypothetical protein
MMRNFFGKKKNENALETTPTAKVQGQEQGRENVTSEFSSPQTQSPTQSQTQVPILPQTIRGATPLDFPSDINTLLTEMENKDFKSSTIIIEQLIKLFNTFATKIDSLKNTYKDYELESNAKAINKINYIIEKDKLLKDYFGNVLSYTTLLQTFYNALLKSLTNIIKQRKPIEKNDEKNMISILTNIKKLIEHFYLGSDDVSKTIINNVEFVINALESGDDGENDKFKEFLEVLNKSTQFLLQIIPEKINNLAQQINTFNHVDKQLTGTKLNTLDITPKNRVNNTNMPTSPYVSSNKDKYRVKKTLQQEIKNNTTN